MKVYLYEDEGWLHAVAETGDRLASLTVGTREPSDVVALREAVHSRYGDQYRMRFFWVEDVAAHPTLRELLHRQQEQEAAPEVTEHQCLTCTHRRVCTGSFTAERIGFTIDTCQAHAPEEIDPT